jgi:hypothetical protein
VEHSTDRSEYTVEVAYWQLGAAKKKKTVSL